MKLFLIILAASFLIARPVAAQELRQGETVVLDKNEVVNQDLFAGGESVTISGTVNGDTYIGAGNILVDGKINGDLLLAGGSITIRGPVRNNIRVFGGNISIGSTVGGNITVGAGNVQIMDSARIGGGIAGGAGNVEIFAPVARGITMGAGQLRIGNTVDGNVVAGVGQLSLTSGANVAGDITYWSEKQADIASDATVTGKLVRQLPPKGAGVDKKLAAGAAFAGMGALIATLKILELIGLFIVGFVMIHLVPKLIEGVSELTNANPWKSLIVGFIAVIVTPVAVVLLFLTGFGAPLALVLLAVSGFFVIVSKVFTAFFVGSKILSLTTKTVNVYGALIVGLLCMTILLVIPILGWILLALLYLTALGGLILDRARFYTMLRGKDLI